MKVDKWLRKERNYKTYKPSLIRRICFLHKVKIYRNALYDDGIKLDIEF
jgi:hypothetical protein